MLESQFCQLWIAWIAGGESFRARWINAPSNVERSIGIAYHLRPGIAPPDVREYVQHMSCDAPATKQHGEGASTGEDRILVHSMGPGDTFCSVSYRSPGPPEAGKALEAFLRYNTLGRIACVAIPNPRFNGLVLEGLPDERIDTLSIDTFVGTDAELFFTNSPESKARMEDVIRAIVSRQATLS